MTDTRQRRVHHNPCRDALRKQRRKSIAHHVSDIVGDEGDRANPKLIQNDGKVSSLRDLFIAAFRMGRETHPSQIGNNDGAVFNERIGERHPHVTGVAKAVKKEDGASRPAEANILRAARHRHLP